MTEEKEEKKEQKKILPMPKKEEILAHDEHKAITEHEKLKELSCEDEKASELEEQLKRVQAEFENYKKRVAKEREELAPIASAEILKKLLPIIEEFELAVAHAKAKHEKDNETIRGFGMVLQNLKSLLEKEGLREMKCEGEQFDPYKHEAVRSEVSDVEEGTIIRVIRKGYFLKDKVLRHASVVLSKGNGRG